MAEIPDWLVQLKQARVVPFTRSEDFGDQVSSTLDIIIEQMRKDTEIYSQDWATVGLPGLANGCLRKASRLFDLFVLDMQGKEKPEDELRDNMMISIYSYIYYKMLMENYETEEEETYEENENEDEEEKTREESREASLREAQREIEALDNPKEQDSSQDLSTGFLSRKNSEDTGNSDTPNTEKPARPKLSFNN